MYKAIIIGTAALTLWACDQQPKTYTLAQAQAMCEDERKDAAGPRGNVTVGASSTGQAFGGVSISLNDKYIRGVDPDVAYQACMDRLTIQNAS